MAGRCGCCGNVDRCTCTKEQIEMYLKKQAEGNKKFTKPRRDNLPFGGSMQFKKRSVARGDRR